MFLIVLHEIFLNHVFTYLFIISRLVLVSISLLIVKRHWAKWKWRYINFVIIIISIISVINNADYRACFQMFYFLFRISTFSRRRCVVVGNILGWVN